MTCTRQSTKRQIFSIHLNIKKHMPSWILTRSLIFSRHQINRLFPNKDMPGRHLIERHICSPEIWETYFLPRNKCHADISPKDIYATVLLGNMPFVHEFLPKEAFTGVHLTNRLLLNKYLLLQIYRTFVQHTLRKYSCFHHTYCQQTYG